MLSPLSCSKPMTILDINYTWIILSINLWSLKFEIEEFVSVYICSSCSRSNHQCIWNLDHSQGKKILKGQKPEEKRGFRYLSARNHVSINRGFSYGRCGLSYTQFGHWRMGARGVGVASTTFTSWGGGGSWKKKQGQLSYMSMLSCVWKKRWCS